MKIALSTGDIVKSGDTNLIYIDDEKYIALANRRKNVISLVNANLHDVEWEIDYSPIVEAKIVQAVILLMAGETETINFNTLSDKKTHWLEAQVQR